MKDQYFGDINDYRKYGLLRSIAAVSDFRMLVAWMLTQDDGSSDGQFTSYLDNPSKWGHHDPVLFQNLKRMIDQNIQRNVGLMEISDLLCNCEFFSTHVPDSSFGRGSWFNSLLKQSQGTDFVFLDPDNGLEVKSRSYGRKYSSKFLYRREVTALWETRKSLLIYQHFIREKRSEYIQRMLSALSEVTPGSHVEAFSTPNVVFLMALQPLHQHLHQPIIDEVQVNWSGQIRHWDLIATD